MCSELSWLYSHCFVHLQFFLNLSHADKTMDESFSLDFSLNDFFVLFSPERKRVLFNTKFQSVKRQLKKASLKKFEMMFRIIEKKFSLLSLLPTLSDAILSNSYSLNGFLEPQVAFAFKEFLRTLLKSSLIIHFPTAT
jgi:hypothetical protein